MPTGRVESPENQPAEPENPRAMQSPNYEPTRDEFTPNFENMRRSEIVAERTRLRAKRHGTDDRRDSCRCVDCQTETVERIKELDQWIADYDREHNQRANQ